MVDRISQLLKEKDMTAKSLCAALGLSASAVTDWKNGKSSPTTKQVVAMAELFGVSTDFLLTGRRTTPMSINQGIFGDQNSHNTITINGDAPRTLSEIESELMRICSELDTRKKNALLAFAYELADKE